MSDVPTDHFLQLYQRELEALDAADPREMAKEYGSALKAHDAIADARTMLTDKIAARKREIGVADEPRAA